MNRYLKYLPLFIAVFTFASFSPFVLCILYFLYFFKKGEILENSWMAIITLSAITVGAINAVKAPDSDLEQYIYLYHLSKDMPLGQYIWVGSTAGGVESVKEPFYPVIVWIMNRFCFDNEALFKFFFTFINYFLLDISILIVGKKNQIDHKYILFGLFLMAFIPYIFTLSLQVLRQFMAGAFFMLILSLVCFSSIKMWKICVMTLIMVLIHSTSLFFVPFLFVKALDKRWSDAKMWYVGILLCLLLIQFLSFFMMKFLGGMDNSFSYALERASQDSEFDSEELGIIAIVLLLLIIYFSYYMSFVSTIKDERGVRRFFNVPLFLSIFVLFNLRQRELALRMLFYAYPFVPLIAMVYSDCKKIKYDKLVMFSIPVILLFLFYLEFGAWTYNIPYTVFFTPLFCYLK